MKPIPNFSRYSADYDGTVYSIRYKNSNKTRAIKASITKDGYFQSMFLRDDNKYSTKKIHRLIAITLIPNPENKPEVNHKNAIKTDNRVENLEWVTHKENSIHAKNMGLIKQKNTGEKSHKAKLTLAQVNEIKEFVISARKAGVKRYGRDKLAEKYGISSAHIKDIVSGRKGIWTH